jgi:MFS family permease
MRRHAAAVLATGLCGAAAAAIWTLLTGTFDDTAAQVFLSALSGVVCTLSGLAGASVLAAGEFRRAVGRVTILASTAAFALAVELIWAPQAASTDGVGRALGVALAVMACGAHASLLLSRLRDRDTGVVYTLTALAIWCGAAATLLVAALLTFAPGLAWPVPTRVIGVLVILGLLATLLTPLARKSSRGTGARRTRAPESRERQDAVDPPRTHRWLLAVQRRPEPTTR